MGSKVNRFAFGVLNGFALIALADIAIALLRILPGPPKPAPTDEGAAAHIFQISVAAAFLMLLLFVSTADWSKPRRALKLAALPIAVLALAFGALYYLEHVYWHIV